VTTTKRHSSRQHDDEEMQEPAEQPFDAPSSAEVGDRASAAGQESISVTANKPEAPMEHVAPRKLGVVPAGASDDVDPPPSVLGTSQDPTRS